MKHRIGFASLLIALVSLWTAHATAQARDPLNEKEVDQMREVADEPNKRLELMVKFIRERMSKIDELEADAKSAKDRPMQIHDLLEDVTTLLDEISDNLDMYGSHNADMRKGLILLIEADSEWQLQLRQLKQHSPPRNWTDTPSCSPMPSIRWTIWATTPARSSNSRTSCRKRKS